MNIADLTITSLETISAFDIVTGNLKFILDELQNASIANSQEKSDITGKGGRKLSSIKRNKSVTISGSNGMVSGGLMGVQTGGSFDNKETVIMWQDYLKVETGNKVTTAYKAVGTEGAEIIDVLVKNADGTEGAHLTQAESAAEGKFAYAPASKTLTLHTDIPAGTEIVVYYKRKIKADVLENKSDVYSEKVALYIDAMAEDKCSNVYRIQFYIPKADFSGEFSIEMGDNQTVHSFEAESLAGGCGALGAGGSLWTYTVFGANTADVA